MTHLAGMISGRALAWVNGKNHPGMLQYPRADVFGRSFKGHPDVVVAMRTAVRNDTLNTPGPGGVQCAAEKAG